MNERIKELAIKAGDDWEHTLEGDREFLGKFAELVVRECAQICRDQTNDFALELDRENCASAIEEHFGVKS